MKLSNLLISAAHQLDAGGSAVNGVVDIVEARGQSS